MVISPSSHSKFLIVYLPGASSLFAGDTAASHWISRAPTLTALVRDGVSGTLRLSDPPRDTNNANNELAHILGLDVTPRQDFANAFKMIHPDLDLTVITASPDAHLLASDISLSTTLLSASSLTPSRLAMITHRAFLYHQAVVMHLPYFAPDTMNARGSFWTTPHRVSPNLELIMGPRRPPEIEPAPETITNANDYITMVDTYIQTILPDARDNGWLVTVVMSWDQGHLSDNQINSTRLIYAELSSELAARNTENNDIDARQVKHFRDSSIRSLPLTVIYSPSDSSHADIIDKLDVYKIYLDGSCGSIGAWSFLNHLIAMTTTTSVS